MRVLAWPGMPAPEALDEAARRLDPRLAALTTERSGYATPNEAARRRLPGALQADTALFPGPDTLRRCHVFRDAGPDEHRFAEVWARVVSGPR